MEYKVVPFVATIKQQNESTTVVAKQLESLIEQQTSQGWKYIRLESVSTIVQPHQGCFGLGAKPAFISSSQMVVFSKDSNSEDNTNHSY